LPGTTHMPACHYNSTIIFVSSPYEPTVGFPARDGKVEPGGTRRKKAGSIWEAAGSVNEDGVAPLSWFFRILCCWQNGFPSSKWKGLCAQGEHPFGNSPTASILELPRSAPTICGIESIERLVGGLGCELQSRVGRNR